MGNAGDDGGTGKLETAVVQFDKLLCESLRKPHAPEEPQHGCPEGLKRSVRNPGFFQMRYRVAKCHVEIG